MGHTHWSRPNLQPRREAHRSLSIKPGQLYSVFTLTNLVYQRLFPRGPTGLAAQNLPEYPLWLGVSRLPADLSNFGD